MQLTTVWGYSKARSALTTAPYKEKEKTSDNKIKKQSDSTDEHILKTSLYSIKKKSSLYTKLVQKHTYNTNLQLKNFRQTKTDRHRAIASTVLA